MLLRRKFLIINFISIKISILIFFLFIPTFVLAQDILASKEKGKQEERTLDIKELINKSKKKIEKVNEEIDAQAVKRRNQHREEKAREYYNMLLEKSKGISYCTDLISKVTLRLKEIEEGKPLEFNLLTFMDASWKGQESIAYSPNANVDIKVEYFNLIPNQDVRVSSFALPLESGCLPVSVEYLWSGDLGKAQPKNDQDSFNLRYTDPGTKLIQLVVVTPSGVLGHNLLFLEVAEAE